MKYFLITPDPEVAAFAVASGVDRIFVDLEYIGKHARQGHLSTVISAHSLADVAKVRPVVPTGQLLVRVNPLYEGSVAEIDGVIRAGADIVMLPMFTGPTEVLAFTQAVAGRARTCLLVETVAAAKSLRECVRVPGVDEVHLGLNDLHLDLKLSFMFEPLANGLVDDLAKLLNEENIPFGIGGIARVGEGMLPAELLLAEHVRLGSTAAILSRTFHRNATSVAEMKQEMDFVGELLKLRAAYSAHLDASQEVLTLAHTDVQQRVKNIVASIRSKDESRASRV